MKLNLSNLENLQNETTATNTLNANNGRLTAAIENTLSRNGQSPNQMGANLDMNSHRVLNLSQPISPNEPVRLQDLANYASGGTVTLSPIPSGGIQGQVLSKNSSSNYDVGWVTTSRVVTPETFGAVSVPVGTAPASVPDSTNAIQLALFYLASIGGGELIFGPGVYGLTSITIRDNNTYLRGAGAGATVLYHICNAPGICIIFSNSGVLSNVGISDLSIGASDIINNKAAILISDCSVVDIKNINISMYPVDGTMYRGSGSSGTGLLIEGRELGTVRNVSVFANNPVFISRDPHLGFSGALDSWTFTDCTFVAPLPGMLGTGNSVITIDDGVAFTNLRFTGHQNWIGGLNGIFWNDSSSAAISSGLYLEGIKSEQAGQPGGYTVSLTTNTSLYTLSVRDAMMGDRNGLSLRKIKSVHLDGVFYDTPSNPTKVGLDIANANSLQFSNCTWFAPALVSYGGLTALAGSTVFPTGLSPDIPACGVYKI